MSAPRGAHVAAEDRGTTTLADGVVEAIAAKAATEVHAAQGLRRSLVGRSVGSPKVRAEVDLHGSVASLQLTLAVQYPVAVLPVTRAVRRHVGDRVRELCDVTVDHVDITVAALPRPETESRRVQ